jgi:hypothetical protein
MPLSDYSLSNFTAGPYTRPVYRRGSGPAVIVIHEVPALHTLVIDFADRLAAAGYDLRQIGNSECAKLDGGMSCLSLRFTPRA